MRAVAENVRAVMFDQCGHFLQEDKPVELGRELIKLFGEEKSSR